MQSFVISIVVLTIPSLALALFRRTWWWPLVLYVVGMLLGQGMGFIQLSDWVQLFQHTGLFVDGLPVLLWLIWSICAGASFDTTNVSVRETIPLGIAVGSVGAALSVKETEEDLDLAGKTLAMRTAALLYPGSMIGGVYFFADSGLWFGLWLTTLVYIYLLRKRTLSSTGTQRLNFGWMMFGFLTLLTSFLLHDWSVVILASTLPVWIWRARAQFPWKHVLYVVGAFACVNLAVGGGLPEAVAWGLEELPMDLHFALPGVLLISTVLLSALVGSIPMAFFGIAMFERLLDLPSIGLSAGPLLGVYGVGLVLGNIRPFVWSRTLRPNVVAVAIGSLVTCSVLTLSL